MPRAQAGTHLGAKASEAYISVDVEAAGPIPGKYSLLQIGACRIGKAGEEFTCFVKPINRNFVPEALSVTGLSLEQVARVGKSPRQAFRDFRGWIEKVIRPTEIPVFVGLNAAFDWSFINYYFHRFSSGNPFGIAPVDIKSMYFGSRACYWSEATSSNIQRAVMAKGSKTHDALEDARYQANLFTGLKK